MKRKIHPNVPFKIKEGMIIELAYCSSMKIIKINFDVNEEIGDIVSEVYYGWLKGELFKKFGNELKSISNVMEDGYIENYILVGRGTIGVEPDIQIAGGEIYQTRSRAYRSIPKEV